VTKASAHQYREPTNAEGAVYKELCTTFGRATTSASSFWLRCQWWLAFSGALALWERSAPQNTPVTSGIVIAFSLVGALISFGLMCWEMRKVQKCDWLIARAADWERHMWGVDIVPRRQIQYDGWDEHRSPLSSIFELPWGKTQSEKSIYGVAITVWFVPIAIVLFGP
jgi:hypothetical protein